MSVEEIAPGLWWWTGRHPDWEPNDFKDGKGWQQEVSSYALVGEDAFVLFDPLVPREDEETFWAALDRDVAAHGPPAILLTIFWHARGSQQILDRYEGASLWAHEPEVERVQERVRVTNPFSEGDILPAGLEAVGLHHRREAAFWLREHHALVLGDSVLGYEGRVELCPPSWLAKDESIDQLESSVRRALERGPERLLLTHGGPRPAAELQL